MLANRLQKRFRHLKKWAQCERIGAFRLYDRDIPEIPLVLDFYGDCNLLCEAALCGALYRRPYEKDETEETIWLEAMKESAAATLIIKPDNVFIKRRQKQKGLSQYEKTRGERFEKTVNEGGLLFKVNLSDYIDTGLFIDRRKLRDIIRVQAAGKKVLNLFSYTGSFSVSAAAGGAASTDSVDLSNTYLKWAKENFELNNLTADFFNKNKTTAHRLIRADVLEFINESIKDKARWDIIVLDPPAFSNSKKMSDNFDLNRELEDMLDQCVTLLAPEGKLFLSVNLKRNAPQAQELETRLCSHRENVRVTDLSKAITDEDFKDRKIPKAFLIDFILT